MEKITDPRHLLQVIKDGVNAQAAGAVEDHLQTNLDAADAAGTSHELYPLVEPALKLLVGGLPDGSAWKATLSKFIDFLDQEVGAAEKVVHKVISKAIGKGKAAVK